MAITKKEIPYIAEEENDGYVVITYVSHDVSLKLLFLIHTVRRNRLFSSSCFTIKRMRGCLRRRKMTMILTIACWMTGTLMTIITLSDKFCFALTNRSPRLWLSRTVCMHKFQGWLAIFVSAEICTLRQGTVVTEQCTQSSVLGLASLSVCLLLCIFFV